MSPKSRAITGNIFSPLVAALVLALPLPLFASEVDEAVHDMQWNHEGTPHGLLASSGWTTKGRVSYWTTPSDAANIIYWGTLYETVVGNPSPNTRVAIKNCRLWMRWGSTWYSQQSFSNVEGGNYHEDFRDNNNISPGDRRQENGFRSLRAGAKSTAGVGRNYHFFAASFKSFGSGSNGVCARCDFYSIKHNANGTDDRNSAQYLVNSGADFYTSGGSWKGDVAIGRFKWVNTYTRRAYMHNLSESDFRNNPPPL